MRGATSTLTPIIKVKKFQSTLLMRGATCSSHSFRRVSSYFNPRSSCEERLSPIIRAIVLAIFQSTLLMRGATSARVLDDVAEQISIHAPHARSDFLAIAKPTLSIISIHAPHARSDERIRSRVHIANIISIHAPHARSDSVTKGMMAEYAFQSTLLMRGATGRPARATA